MEKILFCTDVTEHSSSALEFAIEIAKKTHAKIITVHSYYVPIPFGATFQSVPVDIAKIEADQKGEVDKICNKIRSYEYADSGAIECDPVVAMSHPGIEVLDEAKEYDVNLIIMGSRPVPSLKKWFGTTSTEVARNTEKPVLIVPQGIRFSGFKKIVYAADSKENKTKINDVIEFGKLFNSAITVLHINNPEDEAMDRINFAVYQERVLERVDYPLLEFNSITNKDTIPALIEYVKHMDVDLLVVRKHHYPFFENVFRKSLSDEVIFNSEFPVLIVH